MGVQYGDEKKDFLSHLEELRRRILICLVFIVLFSAITFLKSEKLLQLLIKPISVIVNTLVVLSPTESFGTFIKASLLGGFILSFPVFIFNLWGFISPALNNRIKRRFVLWFIFAFFLFFMGILFSYYILIPTALKFLLNFGRDVAEPYISLGKYISFVCALIVAGGIMFELPAVIGILADAGIVSSDVLKKKRRYAIIAILIISAIITPTQDIVNLLFFATPMILLYEIGILIASGINKKIAE